MTEFDARISLRNKRSDDIINGLIKESKKRNRPRVEMNLVDRVLRPYIHIMNECEIKQVDITQVNEATVSTTVTMFSELAMRTIPKGNPSMIQDFVTDLLADFHRTLLGTIEANFNVQFIADAPPQDPTPQDPPTIQ